MIRVPVGAICLLGGHNACSKSTNEIAISEQRSSSKRYRMVGFRPRYASSHESHNSIGQVPQATR